jgi:hypothetical protein
MQIIDDFLKKDEFDKIKELVTGPEISWFQNQYLIRPDSDQKLDDIYNWQFTHTFYKNYSISSSLFNILDPILIKLNPSAILRIKANLIPRTDHTVVYQMHTDITNFKGNTAIFYINSNNGYTMFKDGTIVESKENRIVIFDSTLEHTGTSCTDNRNRCVINFNYYTWDTV